MSSLVKHKFIKKLHKRYQEERIDIRPLARIRSILSNPSVFICVYLWLKILASELLQEVYSLSKPKCVVETRLTQRDRPIPFLKLSIILL